MDQYRQTKSGTWHLLYINRANCCRHKDANWKNDQVVTELPAGAKLCKKCGINNK